MGRVGPGSIRDAMRAAGNDYSQISDDFARRTGQGLCQVVLDDALLSRLDEPISVVIPSFNGQRTLPATLMALEGQLYRNFEVIVVDDGSQHPLERLVRKAELTVPVTIIRVGQSRGLSVARNVGMKCSGGNSIIFMDDDHVTPPTMTYSLALRHAVTADCVFVGFREDVDAATFFDLGGRQARIDRDWRYRSVHGPEPHISIAADQETPPSGRREFALVHDSSNFMEFGHGRVIGYWDLSAMVVGHSISARRSAAIAAGGFVEDRFHGWGVEDTAFGALMIACGHFIVPALDWTSFHLRHEGRRVTRAEELEQMKDNLERYREYIEEPVTAQRFPDHRLQCIEKSQDLRIYELRD